MAKYSKKELYNMYTVAMKNYFSFDYESAFPVFETLKDSNDVPSTFFLGECYFYGQGVEKNIKTAVSYYESASKAKFPPAMARYAFCFEKGIGVFKNLDTAKDLYKKAEKELIKYAKHGDEASAYILGYFYTFGIGFDKNVEKGRELLVKEANNGNALARFALVEYDVDFFFNGNIKGLIDIPTNSEESKTFIAELRDMCASAQKNEKYKAILGNYYIINYGYYANSIVPIELTMKVREVARAYIKELLDAYYQLAEMGCTAAMIRYGEMFSNYYKFRDGFVILVEKDLDRSLAMYKKVTSILDPNSDLKKTLTTDILNNQWFELEKKAFEPMVDLKNRSFYTR